MSMLLDALDYVGSTLNKPGRAVRGVLGGRPGEAAAIIPFSDSLGLTDRSNEITGQDLMGQAGISTGTQWGDALAGVGVDIATDPLTWFGAGIGNAIGRNLGKAAVAAGPKYATTIQDLWAMRQHPALGIGGPTKGAFVREFPGSNINVGRALREDPDALSPTMRNFYHNEDLVPIRRQAEDLAEHRAVRERLLIQLQLFPEKYGKLADDALLTESELVLHGLPPGSRVKDVPRPDLYRQFGFGEPSPPPPWTNPSPPGLAGEADAHSRASAHISAISNSPSRDAILREIPPGSRVIGSGAEAIAFLSPTGDVVRAGLVPAGIPGRPLSDAVLASTRAIDIPSGVANQTWRIERSPLASGVGTAPRGAIDEMAAAAQRSGLDFWDNHAGNMGFVGGQGKIIDPGAVFDNGFTGAYQPVAKPADPTRIQSALLRALGGDDAIRAAIESGRTPTYTAPLTRLGAEGGAAAGEGGRAMRDRR